uniref:Cytochrome b-c1 complex subunit 8-like n=1 Tax=Rhizophora mucronata TaxID=61149 RepID=A0A2P2IH98_RHIMU
MHNTTRNRRSWRTGTEVLCISKSRSALPEDLIRFLVFPANKNNVVDVNCSCYCQNLGRLFCE